MKFNEGVKLNTETMATVSLAGLETRLVDLGLGPCPSFASADVLNRPLDIVRSYLAAHLQALCDESIQPATRIGNRDLDIVLPKLKLPDSSRGIKGKVKGREVWAFGDTGAGQNIISARHAEELGLEIRKSPRRLRMGNSKTVFSRGSVNYPWAFSENPEKIMSIVAHILDGFSYDILLGNPFLKATQTMTEHITRFVKGSFPHTLGGRSICWGRHLTDSKGFSEAVFQCRGFLILAPHAI
jgi:hypothetical protein